jgi:predicted O-methyltransferase YrrM
MNRNVITTILKLGESVIGPAHCGRHKLMLALARKCAALPGAGAEVGVYKGGSLIGIAKVLQDKIVYGIDTFTGMPKSRTYEYHKEGDFKDVSFLELKKFFEERCPNVTLLKGNFPEEDVLQRILETDFCFVHVDVDIYDSTKACLDYFVPKLVPQGILVVDDYGFSATIGAQRAVDEFTSKLRGSFEHKMTSEGSYKIKRIK